MFEMDGEATVTTPSFDWSFIIEEATNLIRNNDIQSLQYLLDEINGFLMNLCILLIQDFRAVDKSNESISIKLCKPLSKTYCSQVKSTFSKSKIFLVPKSYQDNKDSVDFVQPSELCETSIKSEDIKQEIDFAEDYEEDEREDVVDFDESEKNRKYDHHSYKENYPITKEQFDKMIEIGPPYTCSACNKPYATKTSMIRHLDKYCKGVPMVWPKWRKIPNQNRFFCEFEGCDQNETCFKTYDAIWAHHTSCHAPQQKKTHQCEHCQKTFTSNSNLSHHIKSQHNPDGALLHMCRFCGKSFKAKLGLQYHEMSHTNKKPEGCPHCDFKCLSKSSLMRHIQGVHESNNEEVCDICGKAFNTKYKLKRHIKLHSDISEKCPQCGKMIRNLKRHMFTAHKLTYACPDCPKVFQAPLGVEYHRREEHGYGIVKSE